VTLVLRAKKWTWFTLLPGDGQAAEQRVGKFFQHEKPQQRKLNKSGVFIGFEF
jgi:hypothetical protein